MPSSEDTYLQVSTAHQVPAAAEIDRIAAVTDPILRNLLITQCYYELSAGFAARTGKGANWCTFATWASKQAGQTIRQEDLMRTLEVMLRKEPAIDRALSLVAGLAQRLGVKQSIEFIKHSTLISLVEAAAERAGDAVSLGNKKVFEEIAREFARFIGTCLQNTTYTAEHIQAFNEQLRAGQPPEGQEYLRRGFARYYASLFETDAKKRAEDRLMANLEIGFHEQTRLQPEIAASLNAALELDPQKVKTRLLTILFPDGQATSRLAPFVKRVLNRSGLLDKAIQMLVLEAQQYIRLIMTAHLMALTIPPENRLRLGHDLVSEYPALLQQLSSPDLLSLLEQIDPTPNSLKESGAIDWADLAERMHYITELFRCYHEGENLFAAAFTTEQQAALRAGRIPAGRL